MRANVLVTGAFAEGVRGTGKVAGAAGPGDEPVPGVRRTVLVDEGSLGKLCISRR